MKAVVLFCSIFFVTLAYSSVGFADDLSEEKKSDISQLLDITGALSLGKQMSDVFVAQISQTLKASRPDIPARLFDVLREEVNTIVGESIPMLAELMIPLYHKYYSHDEIKGLITFYKSALGKKTIQVTPVLLQDSIQQGQQWGQALGPIIQKRIIKRFKDEGVDLSA